MSEDTGFNLSPTADITVGQPAIYVLSNGEHRAATIIRRFDPPEMPTARIEVALDWFTDLGPDGMPLLSLIVTPPGMWRQMQGGRIQIHHAEYDNTTKAPGTWHLAGRA